MMANAHTHRRKTHMNPVRKSRTKCLVLEASHGVLHKMLVVNTAVTFGEVSHKRNARVSTRVPKSVTRERF